MVLLSSQWYLATMDFERLRHIPCTCDWCAISFNSCRSSHWHLVAMVNMIPSNITKVSQPSMIIIDNLCIYIYAKHKWSTYDFLWKVDLALGVVAQGWVGPCSASNSCLANAVSSTTSTCIFFPLGSVDSCGSKVRQICCNYWFQYPHRFVLFLTAMALHCGRLCCQSVQPVLWSTAREKERKFLGWFLKEDGDP